MGGVLIPSPTLLYVSPYLDTWVVYYTDRNEDKQAHVGSFAQNLTPCSRGQIIESAIAPQHNVQLLSPLGHIFWYVYMMG